MFDVFKNAWKIEDLRKKLMYTVLILVVYRIGVATPVPFLTATALSNMVGSSGNLLGYIDMLTGGAFSRATLFALSVTPYIQSSIIINLLQVAIPALERLGKEGADGQRKLQRITRYATLALSVALSIAYYYLLQRNSALIYTEGWEKWFSALVIIMCFTAGSMLIMWLGEQIDAKGIGNGISLLIFAGIVARLPTSIGQLYQAWQLAGSGYTSYYFAIPLLVVVTLLSVVFIIIMTSGERRIPVQYAKKVVGRKMYGGQSSHIPIKVNMSGVMPVIFAGSLIAIPGTIKSMLSLETGFWSTVLGIFEYNRWGYAIIYTLLIVGFNYFYVSIQYNPMDIANNLRKNNGTIPGIRPGRPTQEFIKRSINKITLVGAIFLGVVALVPIVIGNLTGLNAQMSGTSLIILVGVALDTMRSLESYMLMRHHKGFLE
ncbi:preprotein translocase subunit SecY [Ruminococcaceae bacterium OttesenSCG-928-N02]|nr:preprotein translocase subunit SecY [Ruminococcaceae bacterium OttesenSCG-928-N02]